MRRWFTGFLALAVVLGAGAGVIALGLADRNSGDVPPLPESRVIFADEFDGESLDTRRWSTCYWWAQSGCTIASNSELEWYLPSQVSIQNGRAVLRAESRGSISPDGTRYEYASGMLSTGPPTSRTVASFAFTYGRAEIRARLPAGNGLWPAFWLLSADKESRPEIDVVEVYGREPDIARMTLHVEDSLGRDVDDGRQWRAPSAFVGEWHTFAIDWRPGRLDWLIDGTRRRTVTGELVPSTAMYLIVNLALGGGNAGPLGMDAIPAEMEIDYVKVFAHPETLVAP